MKTILNSFTLFLNRRGLLPTSIEYYTWHIRKFFDYTYAELDDFGDVKKFRKRYDAIILRESLCNESKNKHLKCAKIFADFLIEEEMITINAPRQIKWPRVQTRLPIPMEDEEITNIFQSINRRWDGFIQYRNTMVIKTLLYTGLRRSELINLQRKDICEEKIIVKAGKWNKDRVVYIPQHFSIILQDYILKTDWVCEYLFFSRLKNPMSRRAMSRIFEEIKKESNIKEVYPHKMRHTYASRSLELGIPLSVLRDQMGHSSIATTNRYISVRNSFRQEAVQALVF